VAIELTIEQILVVAIAILLILFGAYMIYKYATQTYTINVDVNMVDPSKLISTSGFLETRIKIFDYNKPVKDSPFTLIIDMNSMGITQTGYPVHVELIHQNPSCSVEYNTTTDIISFTKDGVTLSVYGVKLSNIKLCSGAYKIKGYVNIDGVYVDFESTHDLYVQGYENSGGSVVIPTSAIIKSKALIDDSTQYPTIQYLFSFDYTPIGHSIDASLYYLFNNDITKPIVIVPEPIYTMAFIKSYNILRDNNEFAVYVENGINYKIYNYFNVDGVHNVFVVLSNGNLYIPAIKGIPYRLQIEKIPITNIQSPHYVMTLKTKTGVIFSAEVNNGKIVDYYINNRLVNSISYNSYLNGIDVVFSKDFIDELASATLQLDVATITSSTQIKVNNNVNIERVEYIANNKISDELTIYASENINAFSITVSNGIQTNDINKILSEFTNTNSYNVNNILTKGLNYHIGDTYYSIVDLLSKKYLIVTTEVGIETTQFTITQYVKTIGYARGNGGKIFVSDSNSPENVEIKMSTKESNIYVIVNSGSILISTPLDTKTGFISSGVLDITDVSDINEVRVSNAKMMIHIGKQKVVIESPSYTTQFIVNGRSTTLQLKDIKTSTKKQCIKVGLLSDTKVILNNYAFYTYATSGTIQNSGTIISLSDESYVIISGENILAFIYVKKIADSGIIYFNNEDRTFRFNDKINGLSYISGNNVRIVSNSRTNVIKIQDDWPVGLYSINYNDDVLYAPLQKLSLFILPQEGSPIYLVGGSYSYPIEGNISVYSSVNGEILKSIYPSMIIYDSYSSSFTIGHKIEINKGISIKQISDNKKLEFYASKYENGDTILINNNPIGIVPITSLRAHTIVYTDMEVSGSDVRIYGTIPIESQSLTPNSNRLLFVLYDTKRHSYIISKEYIYDINQFGHKINVISIFDNVPASTYNLIMYGVVPGVKKEVDNLNINTAYVPNIIMLLTDDKNKITLDISSYYGVLDNIIFTGTNPISSSGVIYGKFVKDNIHFREENGIDVFELNPFVIYAIPPEKDSGSSNEYVGIGILYQTIMNGGVVNTIVNVDHVVVKFYITDPESINIKRTPIYEETIRPEGRNIVSMTNVGMPDIKYTLLFIPIPVEIYYYGVTTNYLSFSSSLYATIDIYVKDSSSTYLKYRINTKLVPVIPSNNNFYELMLTITRTGIGERKIDFIRVYKCNDCGYNEKITSLSISPKYIGNYSNGVIYSNSFDETINMQLSSLSTISFIGATKGTLIFKSPTSKYMLGFNVLNVMSRLYSINYYTVVNTLPSVNDVINNHVLSSNKIPSVMLDISNAKIRVYPFKISSTVYVALTSEKRDGHEELLSVININNLGGMTEVTINVNDNILKMYLSINGNELQILYKYVKKSK